MAEKVKLSKDGNSIDFVQSENIPTSLKKFRHSPEIEGFYRFIFENDLQKEAYEILDRIVMGRKAAKKAQKTETQKQNKIDALEVKKAAAAKVEPKIVVAKLAVKSVTKVAVKTVIAKPAAKAKAPVKAAAKTPAKAKAPAKPAAKPTTKKAKK